MGYREKTAITILAVIILVPTGLSLYDVPAKKAPHVTMVSSDDIQHADSLYDFENKRIDKIKVTTSISHTYTWNGIRP
ncbi:hypothetical protein QWT69_13395 [Sporosarcina oncorhynchi]|uniref:Uncharacterized protein n=1 Tax=Sporosarcina oncorhynchi TaxID=3056444 RepID=A0ABZ0L2L7_9BACL|nr:hypothetical protein [Sporosarcina sp. T2O-4]WOV86857.1 hypothetical protein QWT69_13395 [Sporosarcina sp. T2O-4]